MHNYCSLYMSIKREETKIKKLCNLTQTNIITVYLSMIHVIVIKGLLGFSFINASTPLKTIIILLHDD